MKNHVYPQLVSVGCSTRFGVHLPVMMRVLFSHGLTETRLSSRFIFSRIYIPMIKHKSNNDTARSVSSILTNSIQFKQAAFYAAAVALP